ncbi:MAG: tetratricopeptide repeat protein [Pirellulaceae bacterium]
MFRTRVLVILILLPLIGCRQSQIQPEQMASSATANEPTRVSFQSRAVIDDLLRILDLGMSPPHDLMAKGKDILLENPTYKDAEYAVIESYQKWFDFVTLVDLLRDLPPNEERADRLSYFLIRANRYEEAIELLEKLLEADPDNSLRNWRLAFALANSGDDEQAIPKIEQIIHDLSGSDLIAAYDILGQFYSNKNEFDRAEEYFKKCMEADPNDIHALEGLTRIYEEQDNNRLAQAYREKLTMVRNDTSQTESKNARFNILLIDLQQNLKSKNFQQCEVILEQMRNEPDERIQAATEKWRQEVSRQQHENPSTRK